MELVQPHEPDALLDGATLDNVGTERDEYCGVCSPNIVKNGTPHGALSSICQQHRHSDTRGDLSSMRFVLPPKGAHRHFTAIREANCLPNPKPRVPCSDVLAVANAQFLCDSVVR